MNLTYSIKFSLVSTATGMVCVCVGGGGDLKFNHISGDKEEDMGLNNISAPHDSATGALWHMNPLLTTVLEPA